MKRRTYGLCIAGLLLLALFSGCHKKTPEPLPEPSIPPLEALCIREDILLQEEDGLVEDAESFNALLLVRLRNSLDTYIDIRDHKSIEDGIITYDTSPNRVHSMLYDGAYRDFENFENDLSRLSNIYSYDGREFAQALSGLRSCITYSAGHNAAYLYAMREGTENLEIGGITMDLADYPAFMENLFEQMKENIVTIVSYCEIVE